MSGEVEVELDDIEGDLEYKPSDKENKRAARETRERYEDRFENILTEWYDDKKCWWDAVEACIKNDGEFGERVAVKSRENGEKPRKQVIVEVMVDLLLEVEEVSVHKGLVYVLEEGLSEYSLEFMSKDLLRRGADPNKETGAGGYTPLHMAVSEGNTELIKLLLKKGAHVNVKDDYGSTPLMDAANYGSADLVKILIDSGANVHLLDEDKKTVLHLVSQNDDEEMIKVLLEQGLSVSAEDKNGWTPLHDAAYYGCTESARTLINNGANVHATDLKKQTPLHVAAEEGEEEVVELLLDNKADAGLVDYEGHTALDLAAKEEWESVFEILITHSSSTKHDENHKKVLKKLMEAERKKDDIVASKLKEMSPFGVINMMKSKNCGGDGDFKFIKEFVKKNELKESTRVVMDQFVLGNRRVNCEVIEADEEGYSPDNGAFNAKTTSLLDTIVETNNKTLAQHPAIKALVDYKWKTFARWKFLLSFVIYATRMLLFTVALVIAARPDLDNPGCYRDGWDILRGIFEGLSLILFLVKAYDEIGEFVQYRLAYLKDYYNFLQVSAIILPFTIIPFRAATTWCASTGVGYCALPEGNSTDINEACIAASHVQWIFASIAYLANALLIVEFLALFRTTGIYVRILLKIIKSDIVKFSIIYCVFLFLFVGSFYFALRAGVTITEDGRLVSDASLFPLLTLYPWHVLFTGVRILVESGSIIEGYFGTDENGVYIGYQWFSVVMYLLFLFVVIVILLNLLIAQMSDSYTKVQEDVEGTFAMARARVVARLQKGVIFKTSYRKRFYKKYLWIDIPRGDTKRDQEEETATKLQSLTEKVEKLTTLTEELAEELLKEKREKSKELAPTLDELPDLDDLSDISFDWSDDGDDDDENDIGGDDNDKDVVEDDQDVVEDDQDVAGDDQDVTGDDQDVAGDDGEDDEN